MLFDRRPHFLNTLRFLFERGDAVSLEMLNDGVAIFLEAFVFAGYNPFHHSIFEFFVNRVELLVADEVNRLVGVTLKVVQFFFGQRL